MNVTKTNAAAAAASENAGTAKNLKFQRRFGAFLQACQIQLGAALDVEHLLLKRFQSFNARFTADYVRFNQLELVLSTTIQDESFERLFIRRSIRSPFIDVRKRVSGSI